MPVPPLSVLRPLIAKHLSPTTLAYYWDTSVPTSLQLHRAQEFFITHKPKLLYSTPDFRTVQHSTLPEVAFLGRSNVGKSSLLNALIRGEICHTSKKPGRTKSMNFIAVGGRDENGNPGRMLVLDMPGYGKGSRPEWGTEIMKYLVGRKQLRRAFVLVDASHGLKKSDEILLHSLRESAISHQVIFSKVDRILFEGRRFITEEQFQSNIAELRRIGEQVRAKIQPKKSDGPGALGEIVSCCAEKKLNKEQILGLNEVRWAVLAATGFGEKKRKILPSEMSEPVYC